MRKLFNQHSDALFRVGRKAKMALRMPEKNAFNVRNIGFCEEKSEPDRVPPLDFVHIRLGSPCACLRPGSTTFPKGKPGTRQPRSQAACQPARQTARQLWGRGPGRIPEGRTPGGLRQATSQPARQLALGPTTGTITEQYAPDRLYRLWNKGPQPVRPQNNTPQTGCTGCRFKKNK